MGDGLVNRGQGVRCLLCQRGNPNTFSDLYPTLSCDGQAGLLATFSPSSSLSSGESLILNAFPGPYIGDDPCLSNTRLL